MRVIFIVAVIALAVVLAGLNASDSEAAPAIPRSAATVTDVCVVYTIDGVSSGGIPVIQPDTVSYKPLDGRGFFLWLPGQDRIRVDTLSMQLLPPGQTTCAGILP